MAEQSLVLTIPEVAILLSVSKSTVYRLISDGSIETINIRSKIRVRRSAVERFLDAAQRLHRESTVRF
jgi:excisionase family DNA binding protein